MRRGLVVVALLTLFTSTAFAVDAVTYEWPHSVIDNDHPAPDFYVIEHSGDDLVTWARVDTIPADFNSWALIDPAGLIALRVTAARIVPWEIAVDGEIVSIGELWIESDPSEPSAVTDLRPPSSPGRPAVIYIVAGLLVLGLLLAVVTRRGE